MSSPPFDWRLYLPALNGYPLLPCGAGDKGKAPLDPATGGLAHNWQTAAYSPDAIAALNGKVTCCGTRTGPDAHGLLVFDIDGQSAIDECVKHQCDPFAAPSWHILRDTDTTRLKVCFKVPTDLWAHLGAIRKKRVTKPAPVGGEGEQVELFFGKGQIIVLGHHRESGGFYFWPEGHTPEDLTEPPPEWWALALALAAGPTAAPAAAHQPSLPNPSPLTDPVPLERLLSRDQESLFHSGAGEGTRDDNAFRLAVGLITAADGAASVGLPITGSPERLLLDFAARCNPPFPEREVLEKLASALRQPRTPDPNLSRRLAYFLKAPQQPATQPRAERPASASPSSPDADGEDEQATYSELVKATLQSIHEGRIDDEMQLRAEIMARFRCSDGKLQAELFRQLRRGAVGIQPTTARPRTIDIRKVQGLDWLVDGYVPANDQVLLWGESGAGKTTAVVQLGFAVINGTGFLDRATASKPGRVLFIASDSGAAPFQNTLLDAGLLDHPAFDPGNDQRAFVWACDPDQGMDAWGCNITDIMRLQEFVKAESIDLVVIDSAKAVTSSADIDYTNNGTITAMLTFFKDVICNHTAVVWVSHDGTAKGAHAGAKAWREVPSIAHQIEKVYMDGDGPTGGTHPSSHMRVWNVRKDRMGNERDIRYQIGEGGRLEPCPGVEVIKDCRKAILQVLGAAYGDGNESMSSKEIIEEVHQAHGYSAATIRTNLSRLHRGRNPEVRRCSRPIGHWELAARTKDALSRARGGCLSPINQTPEIPSPAVEVESLTQFDDQMLQGSHFDPIKLSQTAKSPDAATNPSSLIDQQQSPPARASVGSAPVTPGSHPAWLARLVELRQQHPGAAAATLALHLDPDATGRPTGAEVLRWLSTADGLIAEGGQ